jgi:hypothetical protein
MESCTEEFGTRIRSFDGLEPFIPHDHPGFCENEYASWMTEVANMQIWDEVELSLPRLCDI